jgi:hypothetical protein
MLLISTEKSCQKTSKPDFCENLNIILLEKVSMQYISQIKKFPLKQLHGFEENIFRTVFPVCTKPSSLIGFL